MFLPHLQQGVTIINRNLLGDESLASEKLCNVLFSTGRNETSRGLLRVPRLHKQLVPVHRKI